MNTNLHARRVAYAIKSNPKTATRVANLHDKKYLRIELLNLSMNSLFRFPMPLPPRPLPPIIQPSKCSQALSFIMKVLSFKKH